MLARALSALWHFTLGTLLFVCSFASAQEATKEGPETEKPVMHGSLEVTAEAIPIPARTVLKEEKIRSTVPLGDGSEVLRDVTGADLSRMGGHGLDPFIRGQSQGDLTVLLDGATIHGGCPNRMDPATSYSTAGSTDRVEVIRGVQTLRYGPGAPGGTVLFDRRIPEFDNRGWNLNATTGASSWSNAPDVDLDASVGFGDWSLRALATRRDTRNYEDGSGEEVRSAAKSLGATFMLGWRPDENTEYELSYERSDTDDALFAGAGMDAPESTVDIVRFQTERVTTDGRTGWRVDAFFDDVSHLMDNYSLRDLTAPMAMRVPSETSTWGLRGHLEFGQESPIQIGLTIESADADATRFAGPNAANVNNIQSILWAGVNRTQAGAFVEGAVELGSATRFVYGLRADRFTADADRADERTLGGNGPAPRQLWMMYSGNGEDSWSSTDVGGLARIEHRVGQWQLFGGFSRTIRVADATERFLGANSPMTAKRWVGNPGLDPARYHQLDFGAGWSENGSSANLTLFASEVGDYILRDRAHGQEGILRSDNATIYRNVSARRYGVEADAMWQPSSQLFLSGQLAWVWAENTTDRRAIAQTPPLHGNFSAGWAQSRWSVSGVIRWAATQTRVDDNPMTGSGLDAGPTPGWVVLDLAATFEIGAGFDLQAGVANVFDRAYANHLNRASAFDPDAVQVNEPGRTAWIRVRWRGDG
ncbi:MAG: TonB-dependent receptor [bacterium]|nr:TonB-dependent receptor [bacterium]